MAGIAVITAAIDWNMLRDNATQVAYRAYAPYSRLRVGAAALVDDGRVVTGCNVENVSYGLGLCAECGVISALHSTGGGRLLALACIDASGRLLMPAGGAGNCCWNTADPACSLTTSPDRAALASCCPTRSAPTTCRDIRRADADQDQARRRPALRCRHRLGHRRLYPRPRRRGTDGRTVDGDLPARHGPLRDRAVDRR